MAGASTSLIFPGVSNFTQLFPRSTPFISALRGRVTTSSVASSPPSFNFFSGRHTITGITTHPQAPSTQGRKFSGRVASTLIIDDIDDIDDIDFRPLDPEFYRDDEIYKFDLSDYEQIDVD